MSGLFQRIAHRDADPDTSAPDQVEGTAADAAPQAGAPSQGKDGGSVPDPATEAQAPAEAATEQTRDLAPDATEATAPFAPVEAPAASAPAVPPPVIDLTPALAAPQVVPPPAPPERRPGFSERGRMRRRLRYLRRLRELQVRDLGGLVFDLRRFDRQRDDLVAQKLDQIRACDDELRALEVAIDERRDVHDVRAPGIGGTCPRCFALYGSTDRFCSTCGAALGGAVQGPAQVHQAVLVAPAAQPATPEPPAPPVALPAEPSTPAATAPAPATEPTAPLAAPPAAAGTPDPPPEAAAPQP
jgi:hypothetical protein